MLNELEKHEVTTREIAAIVPITVAVYHDAESNWWCVEGIDYPVAVTSTDLNCAENHVRQQVLASWRHWCELVRAMNAPQRDTQPDTQTPEGFLSEEEGYDAS